MITAKITRTPTFDLAYRFVTETNQNIFLTGKAGTGKTTFLKFLRENNHKKMVVAAPTGVAAINAGGVTLHSLFQLPFAPFVPSRAEMHSLLSKTRYQREKLNLLKSLELLIIDEASMVAAHTVDAIDTILKSIRKKHQLPFGGVQVLFIGDLHQLQPVVKREEWEFLRNYYSSIFFFDSQVLKDNSPVIIELKEIFRQKDDCFIGLLNEIRHNSLSPGNLDLLNTRLNKNFSPDENEGYVTLTTHNNQADAINEKKLSLLKAKSFTYNAWVKDDFPEHLYPADQELLLKVGAQVMFIKNDNESKKYFNGKTGVVTELSKDHIKVKCKGEIDEILVDRQKWENINYTLNPDTREVKEKLLGSFEQYPLRLAWAITIHKSQGLTFDKVIIDAENAFANGQVYVALSRCTSLEGLVLTSPVNRRFLGAHYNLKEWQDKYRDDENLPSRLNEWREKFALSELQNVFMWPQWRSQIFGLAAAVEENKENLTPSSPGWIKEKLARYNELYNVAEKFFHRVNQLYGDQPVLEENQPLQQRIKDAANYFYLEISSWKDHFKQHPIRCDTRKVSGKIDDWLDEMSFTLADILQKLNYCKNGFRLTDYLKENKNLVKEIDRIPTSYEGNRDKNFVPTDSQHSALYKELADLRKHLADISDLALYQVFTNAAIRNICDGLPGDKESLLKVKGFGPSKVAQYGDEIIEAVIEYCSSHHIAPKKIAGTKKSKKKKDTGPNSLMETVRIFKEGKGTEEIAKLRNLAVSTIESHLAQAIKKGLVEIEEIIPVEEVQKIAALFPVSFEGYIPLAPVKETAPPEVSYGKLRMVMAWLLKEKK